MQPEKIPRHVAIIMDGNGRWATERNLPRVAGHRAGVEALRDVVKACRELGIEILTLYAFSTENWKRPREEVDALMDLLVEYLRRDIGELMANGVQIRVIGAIDELPPAAREELNRAVELTRENRDLITVLALNYGGRREIVEAARRLARKVQEGKISWEQVDEALLEQHLYTAGLPDPDLLIRPSGEMRLSNFLLWQMAYTEIFVSPVFWPDFRRAELMEAIAAYGRRERRFGGVTAARE